MRSGQNADILDKTTYFQKFFGLYEYNKPGFIDDEKMKVKIGHIKEELAEIEKAYENKDLAEFADGVVDLLYVAIGLGALCNLPMKALYNDVQNSNIIKKKRVENLSEATKRGSTFDVRKEPDWVAPRGAEIIKFYQELN